MRTGTSYKKMILPVMAVVLCLVSGFAVASQRVVEYESDYSDVSLEAVRLADGSAAIAFRFTGTDNVHYYADKETAPGGMSLAIDSNLPEDCSADAPMFPKAKDYYDKGLQQDIKVYSGDFDVVVGLDCKEAGEVEASFTVHGIACTDKLCLPPFSHDLTIKVDTSEVQSWPAWQKTDKSEPEPTVSADAKEAKEEGAAIVVSEFSVASAVKYFLLAILAGLTFNIMPCVWPVLPLAVQRLVNFSGGNKKTLLLHGAAFSGGIILFFVLFAAISVVLKLTTGAALDWSEHLRYPSVIIGMGLLLVVLAMFMFDIFVVGVPSSVASKSGGNGTVSGSIGMGFLAAVLSTPCSGAILAAVLVWAQTQNLAVSTVTIILMGFGMAIPYMILANSPALLKKLPRPGTWMEIFRKAMGFLLLVIAFKLMLALPEKYLGGAFYYSLVVAFAAWMWGGWVNITSPKKKKITVRLLALLLLVLTAKPLLKPEVSVVDWQGYDRVQVSSLTSAGEPVLIKFTAKWCTNCHYLDRTVYSDPEIAKLLEEKGITPVKADTTSFDDPATEDLKAIYNEPGSVPVTIIIAPDGSLTKLRGVFEKKELIEAIESL
ncbi:MAG: protein-disulfide reductase DsbD family protein [Sedimentisphaeraceae bacterium JB056]